MSALFWLDAGDDLEEDVWDIDNWGHEFDEEDVEDEGDEEE